MLLFELFEPGQLWVNTDTGEVASGVDDMRDLEPDDEGRAGLYAAAFTAGWVRAILTPGRSFYVMGTDPAVRKALGLYREALDTVEHVTIDFVGPPDYNWRSRRAVDFLLPRDRPRVEQFMYG